MTQISDDGFWQNIDGEWMPTQKQVEALENGAIPHESNGIENPNLESNADPLFQFQPSMHGNNPTGTQEYITFLGYVLIGFGVLDFLISFTGTDITFFLGFFSTFTPILFWSLGGFLISKGEELPWFEVERFSESDKAKAIYAGTLVAALFILFLLIGLANLSNNLDDDLIGTWTNPVDELSLESNGDVDESTDTFNKWYIEDGNLILEEDDYYYTFKYQLVDEILFLAPIDNDDSVLKEECIAYLKGDAGKTNSAYEDRIEDADSNGDFPSWCQPE